MRTTTPLSRRLAPIIASLLTVAAVSAAQPLRSGIDKTNFDLRVRPQDDLYRHVDGRWLERTPIPADLSAYGAFTVLTTDSERRVHELLEHALNEPAQATPQARKAAALYASFMDERAVQESGLQPLKDELARIDALQTSADVVAWFGHAQSIDINVPLRWYVQQDPRDASAYLPGVTQGGLSMPDRDYYLRDDARFAGYREQLRGYISQLMQLSGDADAASSAATITDIEQRLAAAQWSRVQNRDPVATYHKLDRAELAQLAPALGWDRYFSGIGAKVVAVNIDQPSYVMAVAALLNEVSVGQWRTYCRYRLLDHFAPYLPEAFGQQHFAFHERTLSGTEQQRERWKRAVALVNEAIGEISGEMYVAASFSPAAKQRMQQLVQNLLRAFGNSIDGLAWMTPVTRAEARKKLAAINTKIGYPDRWRDYAALRIESADLVGNVMRASEFEHRRQLAHLGQPVDRTEWHMTPQTVNAYYNPSMNEIVFPAAILQSPFFDERADDAVNYGAIGAVIGHEISHAFDDSGRQFDGQGNLRDWWTEADARLFKERTAALVAQFSAFSVLDNQHVNGELTLGENIADLSGLSIAWKAYQLSLAGRKAPVIDGLTPAQRFFAGWAQIWRRNFRDDNLRQRLSVDPHSPDMFRVNGPVSHIDAFYEAWSVKPGDRLYRPPNERIHIW